MGDWEPLGYSFFSTYRELLTEQRCGDEAVASGIVLWGKTMGDSERRRARERKRTQQVREAGQEFWDALELIEEEASEKRSAQRHNKHIRREKYNESERRYRERLKKEKGK